ncbi:MAG: LPS export ABC transporter ATP-binding protein [Planctomycetaceae bacterium]|nr:LPS export ABC transporter ATP-binding protein [Planctomycetaceae bacterium]
MSLLKCTGLVKDYPGKRAVDGVDFHVERGEIVGLLGPNGAGKTTTFRMACGMIAPTKGQVFLNGQEVSSWPMYKRAQAGMGYLPQDESIFKKLTVEQNIMAVLEYLHTSKSDRRETVDRLLNQFGLEEKRKQVSSTMSGGEKRRLEIARCLATEPSLILLDEPFTGIDPVTIHDIQDIISDLRSSGISILLTDHRERETLTITDRSYIISEGKVLVSGDAETVLSNKDAQDKYFGRRFDATSIIEGKEAFESSAEMLRGELSQRQSDEEEEAAEPEVADDDSQSNEEEADDTIKTALTSRLTKTIKKKTIDKSLNKPPSV